MKTIDITLSSPATAVLIENACRTMGRDHGSPFTALERQTLRDTADAIKTARLRVESQTAGRSVNYIGKQDQGRG